MRKTIYVSERRNRAIADFLNSVQANDVSYEAVKLMEDGMKWRVYGQDGNRKIMDAEGTDKVLVHKVPMPTAEEKTKADFTGIKIERKAIDKSDLDKRLNDL